MALDEHWRGLARMIAEPYCGDLAKLVGAARLLDATDAQLADMINQLLLRIREMHAPIFTPEMIDMIEVELMDNYREQAKFIEKP
jgi:hypothetical protein